MHVSGEIRDGLMDYKRKTGASNVDIANKIRMTPQNLGRILSGQIKSVNDDSAPLILNLLKMKKAPAPVAVERGPLLRINYNGTAMNPVLEQGSIIMAESIDPGSLKDGDIVVARIKEDDGKFRVLCRYFKINSNVALFYPERKASKEYDCPLTKIDWCAKVILPAREITLRD